jgi:hypothetical protein
MSDPQYGPVFASFDDVTMRLAQFMDPHGTYGGAATLKRSADDWEERPDICCRWIDGYWSRSYGL